jgi:hypothetical protein
LDYFRHSASPINNHHLSFLNLLLHNPLPDTFTQISSSPHFTRLSSIPSMPASVSSDEIDDVRHKASAGLLQSLNSLTHTQDNGIVDIETLQAHGTIPSRFSSH